MHPAMPVANLSVLLSGRLDNQIQPGAEVVGYLAPPLAAGRLLDCRSRQFHAQTFPGGTSGGTKLSISIVPPRY